MNARVATVRSKLVSMSQRSLSTLNATWRAYPKPAVDKVASSTLILGSLRNSCNDLLRWLFVSLPSRRVYPMLAASSAGGMRSRVVFQNEKTTLQELVDGGVCRFRSVLPLLIAVFVYQVTYESFNLRWHGHARIGTSPSGGSR